MLKYFVIFFLIVGLIGHFFGDRIYYFQAHVMIEFNFPVTAYKALGKVIRKYPQSPIMEKVKALREKLRTTDPEVKGYAQQEGDELARELLKNEKEKALKGLKTSP